MPLAIAGVALGAAVIGSSIISSNAAKKAATIQQAGVDKATALNQQIFDQNQKNYEQSRTDTQAAQAQTQPYQTAGSGALAQLAKALGISAPGLPAASGPGFQKSPGYDFAFNEGQRAIDTSAASKGLYATGSRGKALAQYGTNVGNQEYGTWVNRLQTLANIGQAAVSQNIGAAGNLATLAANNNNASSAFGATQGSLYTDAAAARASGYVGSANAVTGGINNLTKLYGMGAFG